MTDEKRVYNECSILDMQVHMARACRLVKCC